MQLNAAVLHFHGVVAGNGLGKGVLSGLADTLVGALDALLGVHIVLICHIACQIRSVEGHCILHGKGLDGFHQVICHLGGAVHRYCVKAQHAVPAHGVVAGLGIVVVIVRPAAGTGGGKAQLGIDIAVVQPEGHIHALDLVDMVLAAEHLGQQGLALEVLLQLFLSCLFVQLEGDDEVGAQVSGKLSGQHDGVAAEGAGRSRHGVIAHDLAAAALAGVGVQTGSLALCPAAAGGSPVHPAGLRILQILIVTLQCVHLKLGVAVGAFQLLGGAVKFDRTIAAGALIFQHSCHSVSSYSLRGKESFPAPQRDRSLYADSAAVVFVERIAALRAELGRVCGVSRFPAALVALIFRHTGGTGFAAL